MSVVLIRAGEHSTALVTERAGGEPRNRREILGAAKSPGIRGIAGATILGDGRIVIILDMGSLVRSECGPSRNEPAVLDQRDRRTVRAGRGRLDHGAGGSRNGCSSAMACACHRQGRGGRVSLLQENMPDIILLDIEIAAHGRLRSGRPRCATIRD